METDALSVLKTIELCDGVHAFLSQLESCIHIGASFECLTSIGFEYIVDVKKSNGNDEKDDQ